MEGRWASEDGLSEETWSGAGGALLGVAFDARGPGATEWEALALDVDARGVAYVAMPGGASPTRFALRASVGTRAVFENPAHDFPKTLAYSRAGDVLSAHVAGDASSRALDFAWRRTPRAPAAELEDADRRFDEAVHARGVDAWVEAFDPEDGTMMGPDGPARGHDAVRARMARVLAGGVSLRWAPVASGWSPRRDLGFTVGRSRSRGPRGESNGTYLTIWRRDRAGTPRVLFDTGYDD